MILEINWLAVIVAAFVTFTLGGVWYGPLFGRAWRANYLFAGRRLALFAVDAGYNVVLFSVMGLIIGLFG